MSAFSTRLLKWYSLNKRDLPWRKTKDPYKIWLSEVILQQTRVSQGMPYYLNFINKYPSVKHLAAASEEEVLKTWQGLGYYSRGRNLHKAAQWIVNHRKAVFPSDYQSLITLPGVGPYTAAAVSSISANEPVSLLDGNVYRFYARYFGVQLPINSTEGLKKFREIADKMMPVESCGEFNQALMEFGATVCTPKKALCTLCVFQASCFAYKKEMVDFLPVKIKKTKVKTVKMDYLVLFYKDKVMLRCRSGEGIWRGLYDFPEVGLDKIINSKGIKEAVKKQTGIVPKKVEKLGSTRLHKLSHRTLQCSFYLAQLPLKPKLSNDYDFKLIKKTEIHKYPLPRVIEQFVNENNDFF